MRENLKIRISVKIHYFISTHMRAYKKREENLFESKILLRGMPTHLFL